MSTEFLIAEFQFPVSNYSLGQHDTLLQVTERGAGLEVELSDGHTTFLPFSWLREVTRWARGRVSCHTSKTL